MTTATATHGSPTPSIRHGRVSKSPGRLAFERFLHNKAAVVSVVVLLIIILLSAFAPFITHWSPSLQDLANTDAPPSAQHILGTDPSGIDFLALDLYGGRVDLTIGFVDTAFVMTVAILLGGLAGYYGGWVDSVVMRVCDFMLNFPLILLIIVLTAIVNQTTIWLLIFIIGITSWAGTTRFIRGLFLNLRESEYVMAAKIAGAGGWRIIFRHMLPNAMGTLVVNATLLMAGMIFTEAALAIIGFSVPPTIPTWGNVLNQNQGYFTLATEPWAWMPPALLISVTILCINFIGDGLRDAFDPSFEK